MSDLIRLNSSQWLARQEAEAILDAGEVSRQYGLVLSTQEALELVEECNLVLEGLGRIELGSGVIPKLIRAFCASRYLSGATYLPTMHRLVALFYQCRGELGLGVTDDDIIDWMACRFETTCQGSLELLEGRELDSFLRQCMGLDEPEPEYDEDEGNGYGE